MSARRPTRRRVCILDAVNSSSDAASGWRPSVDEVLMRRSIRIGSGADRSIMAWAHNIERPGVIEDQSSCRPNAAERQ